MADKKKSGITIMPTFVDGEQPSAYKFNTIGAQVVKSAYAIESSIGDIWEESYPHSTISNTRLSAEFIASATLAPIVSQGIGRRLDLTSLGRVIGPASNLNPLTLSMTSTGTNCLALDAEIQEEPIPAGVNSFTLRYVPSDIAGVVFSDQANFSSANRKNTAVSVQAVGDWAVDLNGVVYSFSKTISSPGTATYKTKPASYGGGASYVGATFNVIPDPNQIANLSSAQLQFSQINQGEYMITLPVVRDQQFNSNFNNTNLQSHIDINQEKQLILPFVITQACGGSRDNTTSDGTAGTVVPEGMIYLRNETNEKIYTEATYYYNTRTTIKIKLNEVLDIVNDKFSLITVGTNLTSSVMDLYRKQFFHSHSREFGEPLVSWADLGDVFRFAGSSGTFIPSQVASNKIPQYLHRDGSRGQDMGTNDDNAMRGDLIIGRKKDSSNNTISTAGGYTGSGESFKLSFGQNPNSVNDLAAIYKNGQTELRIDALESNQNLFAMADNMIRLDADKSSIYGTAGSGINLDAALGFRLKGMGGEGLVQSSDTLSLTSSSDIQASALQSKGIHLMGGTTLSHNTSNEPREGLNSVQDNDWYHPKIACVHYTAAGEKVFAYANRRNTITPATSAIGANVAVKSVQLPSWLQWSNATYITDVRVLWSIASNHGNSSGSGLNPALDGFNDQIIPTYNWYGGSTPLNTNFGNGVSWEYTVSGSTPYLRLFWPMDTSILGDGGGSVITNNSVWADSNDYKYIRLDYRILIWYRKA